MIMGYTECMSKQVKLFFPPPQKRHTHTHIRVMAKESEHCTNCFRGSVSIILRPCNYIAWKQLNTPVYRKAFVAASLSSKKAHLAKTTSYVAGISWNMRLESCWIMWQHLTTFLQELSVLHVVTPSTWPIWISMGPQLCRPRWSPRCLCRACYSRMASTASPETGPLSVRMM